MKNSEHISILVVNHDRWARHRIADMLRETGFGVEEASNGMAALRRAVTSPPHIVLIGDQLPEISTEDVLHTLRDDPRMRNTAVVHLRDVDHSAELLATVVQALEARHAAEIHTRGLSPAGDAAVLERRDGVAAVHRARTRGTRLVTPAGRRD